MESRSRHSGRLERESESTSTSPSPAVAAPDFPTNTPTLSPTLTPTDTTDTNTVDGYAATPDTNPDANAKSKKNVHWQDLEETKAAVLAHIAMASHYDHNNNNNPHKRGRGRPRASSVERTARDESTESQSRMAIRGTITHVTYRERDALKQIAPHLRGDIDNYPMYLLENVTIQVPPGLSPEAADHARNILHQLEANLGLGLKVTGLLIVDDADKDKLIKHAVGEKPIHLDRQYITLGNVEAFSIGIVSETRAVALWVLSQTGWFEVRPHAEYRIVFENMRKAIGLKFFIEDWYDGPKATKIWQSIDDEILEILRQFTAFDVGAADSQHEWVLRCREYKQFFITQLDQADNATTLKQSSIYEWFRQGCPDLQPSFAIQQYGPEPDPPHSYPEADSSVLGDDSDYQESEAEDDDVNNPNIRQSGNEDTVGQNEAVLSMDKPFKDVYVSRNYPRATPTNASIPLLTATLICHMVDSGRCEDPETLTVKGIDKVFYKDINVHCYGTCKKLIRYFGQEIVALLPDEYRNYPFYNELATSPKDLTVYDEELKKLKHFEKVDQDFKKIIELDKSLPRRSETNMEYRKAKNHAIKYNLAIPPRPNRNSRRKALAGHGSAAPFGQQQAPGSFAPDVEMENGQPTSAVPLKPYRERYSYPRPPNLDHCVSPSDYETWVRSLNAEDLSRWAVWRMSLAEEEYNARIANMTPEEIEREKRNRRIKASRKSLQIVSP